MLQDVTWWPKKANLVGFRLGNDLGEFGEGFAIAIDSICRRLCSVLGRMGLRYDLLVLSK